MLARLTPCILAVGLVACSRAHHTSMHDAALRMVCGSNCRSVGVQLRDTRHAGDYATAFVHTIPTRRFPDATFLFQRRAGDWDAVDAWADLGGLDCAALAHQTATPEDVLRKLGACP